MIQPTVYMQIALSYIIRLKWGRKKKREKPREAAQKSSSTTGQAIKALLPPPSSFMAIGPYRTKIALFFGK